MLNEVLYTPEEIAQKLKLSKYTVYDMIKKGHLPAHRIGRSLRITERQLENYMIQSQIAANTYEAVIVQEENHTYAQILNAHKNLQIAVSTKIQGSAKISIHPEDIIISRQKFLSSARNMLEGTIINMDDSEDNLKMTIDIGVPLIAAITKLSAQEMNLQIGDNIIAIFKALSVIIV